MRSKNLLFLLAVVLTCGLIAAGCGDSDSDSTTSDDTTATESTTTSEATDTTATEDTTTDSGGTSSGDVDSEGVYNACIDAISGTPAEAAGETACAQARDAFEQCAKQAESLPEDNSARDDAIAICQDAADQAIKSLEATG